MNTAHVIGVVVGSGGVGASVLTAAIAVRAAQAGLGAVCLDGDRLGGGLDVMFGLEQERGVRWPDLAGARGRIDGPELLRRLPSVDGVGVLSFDRARDVPAAAKVLREVLLALSGAVDVVVVDLPRPDHEIFTALAPSVDAMALLAGAGICDLAGASAIVEHLIQACDDVWLCLRTRGRGSHFVDTVAGPWTCLCGRWSVRNRRWPPTCSAAYRQEAPPRALWLPRQTQSWRGASAVSGPDAS